jgi:molybdate transport system substrate-binding protein
MPSQPPAPPAARAVRIVVSNSLRGAAGELLAQYTGRTGIAVDALYDTAQALVRRVAAGERADLALLGSAAIDEWVARGVLEAASVRPIAQSCIGVGVRAGTPLPDLSTPARFVAALRAAQSIAHTTEGASGVYFGALLAELGLADELRPKIRTRPGGLIGELLVAGAAQLGVQQMSELMAVPGVTLAGPLPVPYRRWFPNSGARFAGAADAAGARALLDFLSGPEAARQFAKHGLEPIGP